MLAEINRQIIATSIICCDLEILIFRMKTYRQYSLILFFCQSFISIHYNHNGISMIIQQNKKNDKGKTIWYKKLPKKDLIRKQNVLLFLGLQDSIQLFFCQSCTSIRFPKIKRSIDQNCFKWFKKLVLLLSLIVKILIEAWKPIHSCEWYKLQAININFIIFIIFY